jgi:hypothetical protein
MAAAATAQFSHRDDCFPLTGLEVAGAIRLTAETDELPLKRPENRRQAAGFAFANRLPPGIFGV